MWWLIRKIVTCFTSQSQKHLTFENIGGSSETWPEKYFKQRRNDKPDISFAGYDLVEWRVQENLKNNNQKCESESANRKFWLTLQQITDVVRVIVAVSGWEKSNFDYICFMCTSDCHHFSMKRNNCVHLCNFI